MELRGFHALTKIPTQSPKPVEILLLEDNPGDIRLFQEALKECELPCHLSVLRHGGDVLSFLRQEVSYAQGPRPALIVLDFNIPGISGEGGLQALRSLPAYRTIPVVIFSSIEEHEGRKRSAQIGATAYIPKPFDLQAFFAAVKAMVSQWGIPDRAGEEKETRRVSLWALST